LSNLPFFRPYLTPLIFYCTINIWTFFFSFPDDTILLLLSTRPEWRPTTFKKSEFATFFHEMEMAFVSGTVSRSPLPPGLIFSFPRAHSGFFYLNVHSTSPNNRNPWDENKEVALLFSFPFSHILPCSCNPLFLFLNLRMPSGKSS